jgi:hypothetical protein
MASLLAHAHGRRQWLAGFVAIFGLLLTIFGCLARNPAAVPYAVGLYITSAYWFTASTSFANPAVTIARSLSDTFAGITPAGSPEGANTSSADAFRAASRERAGAGLGCRRVLIFNARLTLRHIGLCCWLA